jgi:hypothetical protein
MSNTATNYFLLLFIYRQANSILAYADFVFIGKPSHLLQVSKVIRILTYELQRRSFPPEPGRSQVAWKVLLKNAFYIQLSTSLFSAS